MTGRPARSPRGLLAFLQVLGAGLALLGIAGATQAGISLPQAAGGSLTLTDPATRIVTLAPNLAELVFAAGAGDKLMAVVEYSDFPPAVKELTRVGNAFSIDLERIIELEPQLIIAWKSGNPQTALLKLEKLGFPVWQIEITRPEEIADAVANIALAAGTGQHGQRAAAALRGRLAGLQQRHAGKSPVEYFYQIEPQPLYTINGQHIISRSLAICGGENVFSELPALAPQIDREAVILADPQVMIAPQVPDAPDALTGWRDWPRLQAVQNNHLLYLPADGINRAAPRLLDSIELACKLLDEVRTR